MSSSPTTTVATAFDTLDAHAATWDALTERAPQGLPMLSHAWVRSVLETLLAPNETWACVFAHDGDVLVGVLPFVVTPHGLLRRLRPRLRVYWESAAPHGDVLVDPDRAEETLAALLAAVFAHTRGFSLELGSVRDGSPTRAHMDELHRFGAVHQKLDVPGACVPTDGPFDGWWSGVSKNLKKQLRKGRNRAERDDKGTVVARFHTGADADPAWLDTFLEIEAKSWKATEGTAISNDARELAFYRALVARLAERGWLEWHVLEVGDAPAAAHLAIRTGRHLTVLDIAFDEAFETYSPGALLMEACVRRAFEDEATDEANFMNTQPWQSRWNVSNDAYDQVRIFRGVGGALVGYVPACLRMGLKRVPGVLWLAQKLGVK